MFSLQIRRLFAILCGSPCKACLHEMAGIFPVQLENDKFLERKGGARRISERLKVLGRVVIYVPPLKRKALYRCRLAAIGLSLKLTPSSRLAHDGQVQASCHFVCIMQAAFPFRQCITTGCASVLTTHELRPSFPQEVYLLPSLAHSDIRGRRQQPIALFRSYDLRRGYVDI